ncbi:MAG TPA: RraA family protein [Hyphomicrobiaceae bacterium]|nr:RraA family protein [Hyphomicrobiaceae bacterium]
MLKDPPLLTIRRDFPRPDLARVDKLVGAQTGHMTDAMYGRGGLDAAIKPVDPKVAAFAGIALPCESFADDNLAIVAALAFAKPGDVLIAASDGFARTAVVGDNVTLMAKHAGVRAIVVDGMVRDLDGIEPVGLPVFARGITPNSCVKNGPGKVGLPIVAGGVRIEPGDVVIGDRDGVVVIPQGQLDHILAHLEEIRRMEAEVQGRIKREKLVTLDSMRALLASDKVTYVD